MNIIKVGSGKLIEIVNMNPQRGKKLAVYMDGQHTINLSLGRAFIKIFRGETASWFSTDPINNNKNGSFEKELGIQTDGEVTIVYK